MFREKHGEDHKSRAQKQQLDSSLSGFEILPEVVSVYKYKDRRNMHIKKVQEPNPIMQTLFVDLNNHFYYPILCIYWTTM